MQDIANATGFSRNTVSKALNGNPAVPEGTRSTILEKAAEMNCKHFAQVQVPTNKNQGGNIALFTYHMPNISHFGSQFISAFTERNGFICANDYITISLLEALKQKGGGRAIARSNSRL